MGGAVRGGRRADGRPRLFFRRAGGGRRATTTTRRREARARAEGVDAGDGIDSGGVTHSSNESNPSATYVSTCDASDGDGGSADFRRREGGTNESSEFEMTGRDAAREGVARAMRTTLTMSSMISRLRVGSTPMLARGASVDAISRVVAMRRAADGIIRLGCVD